VAVIVVVARPRLSFAFPTLAPALLLGLFVAWQESRTLGERLPAPLGREDACFERPLARLWRRLRLGHMPLRSRLLEAALILGALVFGLVAGVDPVEAAGGMTAAVLGFFAAHNLGLAGALARMEHELGAALVTTVAPPAGELPLLVLVPG
jgi:hypothetical protein